MRRLKRIESHPGRRNPAAALPACLAAHRGYTVKIHNPIARRKAILPQENLYFHFITNHKTCRNFTTHFPFEWPKDTGGKTAIITASNRTGQKQPHDFPQLLNITDFLHPPDDNRCGDDGTPLIIHNIGHEPQEENILNQYPRITPLPLPTMTKRLLTITALLLLVLKQL